MMLSDDELAEIAYAEMMRGRVGAELGGIFRAPDEQVRWIGIARAIRTALTGPVTPLAPGETVTIPDSVDPAGELGLSDLEGLDGTHELRIDAQSDSNWATLYLDAAGVRALQTACQRFLAAQEGDDGTE